MSEGTSSLEKSKQIQEGLGRRSWNRSEDAQLPEDRVSPRYPEVLSELENRKTQTSICPRAAWLSQPEDPPQRVTEPHPHAHERRPG